MGVLKDLQPQDVFRFFEEICSIPHGSGNMGPIADYCIAFAEKHGFEHYRDDMNNVIIVKEATKGYENSPAVIIQGHLDMVCAKTADSKIDFMKDGLELFIDGDFIRAKGTTLGGDNGIAIAMALALLDSDTIEHPRVEAVFTVDEETGLYGAEAIDVSMLKAKKFINLDSEDEGYITVSCAGGITAECKVPAVRKEVSGTALEITAGGLLGGHSGMEIDKGRANANMLLGRLLFSLNKSINLNLAAFEGGKQDNAIPKEASMKILVAERDAERVEALCSEYAEVLKNEYKSSDPNVCIAVKNCGNSTVQALDEESTKKAITLLVNFPDGIQAMSMDIKGLPETSLNLGIVELHDECLFAVSGLRSAVETAKYALSDKVLSLVEYLGGSVEFTGNYPGWEYKKDSALRETVIEVFKKQYGKEPIIEAIHAGLECGLFSEKIQDLDCVSIGPDMTEVHTVDERLSISSVERTWNLLLGILKESK